MDVRSARRLAGREAGADEMTGDSKPRFWRWFAGQRHWDDDVGKLSIKFSDDPHAPHSAARFVSYVRWHVDATHEDRVASENAVAAWKKL